MSESSELHIISSYALIDMAFLDQAVELMMKCTERKEGFGHLGGTRLQKNDKSDDETTVIIRREMGRPAAIPGTKLSQTTEPGIWYLRETYKMSPTELQEFRLANARRQAISVGA
jgi:hypothetical protein